MKILFLCIRHIHSKETNTNATRKQNFLQNINVSCRICLQITQSCIYTLKLPSEVKMFSLKKKSVVSLNIYSQAQNRKLKAEYLTIPRKKVQDHSKKFPRHKNNNKIFLGKATGYNDHYMINMVWQRPKTGNNWPLTSPYSQRCDNIFLVMTGTCHKADFLRQHVSCK